MTPNQSIEIRLVSSSGQAAGIGNVLVQLYFYTNGKLRYGFCVGRTDKTGRLHVSYADVEALRRENSEFDLMDYNTKLEDCDPRVEVVISSEEELRKRCEDVLRSYRQPPAWASNWPANVKVRAQRKSVDLAEERTLVELSTA